MLPLLFCLALTTRSFLFSIHAGGTDQGRIWLICSTSWRCCLRFLPSLISTPKCTRLWSTEIGDSVAAVNLMLMLVHFAATYVFSSVGIDMMSCNVAFYGQLFAKRVCCDPDISSPMRTSFLVPIASKHPANARVALVCWGSALKFDIGFTTSDASAISTLIVTDSQRSNLFVARLSLLEFG